MPFFDMREDDLKMRISRMESSEQEHYLLFQAASKKCKWRLHYCLENGADLTRGTANDPEWIVLEFCTRREVSAKYAYAGSGS